MKFYCSILSRHNSNSRKDNCSKYLQRAWRYPSRNGKIQRFEKGLWDKASFDPDKNGYFCSSLSPIDDVFWSNITNFKCVCVWRDWNTFYCSFVKSSSTVWKTLRGILSRLLQRSLKKRTTLKWPFFWIWSKNIWSEILKAATVSKMESVPLLLVRDAAFQWQQHCAVV